MGLLGNPHSGATLRLYPRQLIGRSSSADRVLPDGLCSSRHCEISWTDRGWTVLDLTSRNGTWIDGRRLAPTDRVPLRRGHRLAFGNPASPWDVIDDAEPVAVLVSPERVATFAEDDLLVHPEDARVTVRRDDAGRWILETHDALASPAPAEATLPGRNGPWRLLCPEPQVETERFVVPYEFSALSLRFVVGARPAQVMIEALLDGVALPVEPRNHHQLLLLLARARERDRDLPPEDRGWSHRDMIQSTLRIDEPELNQQIFRARRQFGRMGIAGASRIIERRTPDGLVRLGVPQLEIKPLH
jgi:hypothetical protein